MATQWIGWAAFEEIGDPGTVVCFESDYKTREACEKNVSRCVSEWYGVEVVANEVRVYGLDGTEAAGEELTAYVGETDFHVAEAVVQVTKAARQYPEVVADLARDCDLDAAIVLELFDCWMLATGGRDYGDEAAAFRDSFRALHGLAA